MEYNGKTMRHELKYAINQLEYHYLKPDLRQILDLDHHASQTGSYHIRSLYFDDPFNSAYEDKEAGVKDRGKYRLRVYNRSDHLIKLEYKQKVNNLVAKTSTSISRELYEKIMRRSLVFKDVQHDPLLSDFYLAIRMQGLAPKLVVDYLREPFISRMGNIRVTFDKHLQAGLNRNDLFGDIVSASPILPGSMILEIKYDDYLPEHIRKSLQMARHQLLAVSKYTLCRECKNALTWKERPL